MRKLLIIFITITSILFGGKTITLATDPFPPSHSPDTKDNGFFAEIVREAFKVKGYTLQIAFVPWNRALENAANGYYDGVIGALYSEERARKFIFSDSVYKMYIGLYVRNDFPYNKSNIKNAEILRLGKVRGYHYPNENIMFNKFDIIENSNIESNLLSLINKRVDLIIESNVVIDNLLNTDFFKEKEDIYLFDTLSREDYKIMISKKIKNAEEIKKTFNQGLNEIRNNGTYNKILKKYGIK